MLGTTRINRTLAGVTDHDAVFLSWGRDVDTVFRMAVMLACSSMWPRHGHALPRDDDARVFLRLTMTRRQGAVS